MEFEGLVLRFLLKVTACGFIMNQDLRDWLESLLLTPDFEVDIEASIVNDACDLSAFSRLNSLS